jgi:hypothetical protein
MIRKRPREKGKSGGCSPNPYPSYSPLVENKEFKRLQIRL